MLDAPQGTHDAACAALPFNGVNAIGSIRAFGAKDAAGVPHPFVHRNLSTFDAVAVPVAFRIGVLLADHCVQGRNILAGRRCVEMARAAFARGDVGERPPRLTDVVWIRVHRGGWRRRRRRRRPDPFDVDGAADSP